MSATWHVLIRSNLSPFPSLSQNARERDRNGSRECSGIQRIRFATTESGETQLVDSEPATCTCNLYIHTCVNTGGVHDPTSNANQGLSLRTYLFRRSSSRVKGEYWTSVDTDSIMRLVSTKPFIHWSAFPLSELSFDFLFFFLFLP